MSGKLTKVQHVRLFLGRTVYWMLWGPAVAIVLPFAILAAVAEFLGRGGRLVESALQVWNGFSLRCGNAVFGRAGRAALQQGAPGHAD